ncbi:MAG: thioredoxin [Bacillaceae bacterium]
MANGIINATTQTFDTEISKGLTLVDFWAPWCGPCRMIAPVLEELVAEMGDKVKVVKVDVDDNQEIAVKYEVMSIPTLILFKDGVQVAKTMGFQPKEALVEFINSHQ